jgi:hypothetical protein
LYAFICTYIYSSIDERTQPTIGWLPPNSSPAFFLLHRLINFLYSKRNNFECSRGRGYHCRRRTTEPLNDYRYHTRAQRNIFESHPEICNAARNLALRQMSLRLFPPRNGQKKKKTTFEFSWDLLKIILFHARILISFVFILFYFIFLIVICWTYIRLYWLSVKSFHPKPCVCVCVWLLWPRQADNNII